jgi:quercetin dioxygenase-like cupin family protein
VDAPSNALRHVPSGGGTTFEWSNDTVRVLTSSSLTGGNVTVVLDTLKPGFQLARHHHERMIEIFLVLDGAVTFTFDDETVVAGVGDTVNVVPGTRHAVSAPEGARIITVFSPGGFDSYLAEVRALVELDATTDAEYLALAEKFDIWQD